MLKLRILTALVGAPIALFLAWQGGSLFTGTVAILAFVGWREYFKLLPLQNKPNLVQWIGSLGVILFVLNAQGSWMPLEVLLSGSLLILFSLIFFLRRPQAMPALLFSLAGFIYIGFGFSQFVLLRNWQIGIQADSGLILLAMVVFATWMNDSCAYFVGSMIGKNKLCPEISPAKSWEGAIGGIIGAIGMTTWIGTQFLGLPLLSLLLLGALVGIAGILGDLAESGLKRWAGIKDSGAFFPGHGGVLDRMDSLLFVIPVTCMWLQLFMK